LVREQIIVLKNLVNEEEITDIVEQQKNKAFRSFLRGPKKSEIHIKTLTLFYEAFLIVSGQYNADYIRKTTHSIPVDSNVSEIILGNHTIQVKQKTGVLSKIGKKVSKRQKNQVEIEIEEHVFIEENEKIIFELHGNKIDFPYKLDSEFTEPYGKRVLNKFKENIRELEIKHDAAISKLKSNLTQSLEVGIRDLNEKITINEILEIYVPIYEARLIGPNKKVAIMRVDGVRKKVL